MCDLTFTPTTTNLSHTPKCDKKVIKNKKRKELLSALCWPSLAWQVLKHHLAQNFWYWCENVLFFSPEFFCSQLRKPRSFEGIHSLSYNNVKKTTLFSKDMLLIKLTCEKYSLFLTAYIYAFGKQNWLPVYSSSNSVFGIWTCVCLVIKPEPLTSTTICQPTTPPVIRFSWLTELQNCEMSRFLFVGCQMQRKNTLVFAGDFFPWI